jgi:hypothetical protein
VGYIVTTIFQTLNYDVTECNRRVSCKATADVNVKGGTLGKIHHWSHSKINIYAVGHFISHHFLK